MPLQDKKHWSAKSDLKHDELKDAVELAVDWVLAHKGQAAGGAAAIAVVAALAALAFYSRRARADAAWDGVIAAESAAGHAADAQPLIARVMSEGGSASASAMARLLDGDLRYAAGQYDQALDAYAKAAAEAPENLKDFALADTVQTLEAAGKSDQCVAAAQSFLDAHGEDLLAPQVHAGLARCLQAQGQADAAKAALQKIALQYPGTPWADWAAARLAAPAAAK